MIRAVRLAFRTGCLLLALLLSVVVVERSVAMIRTTPIAVQIVRTASANAHRILQ